MEKQTTHFGFEEVPVAEKVNKVAGVFRSVASRYDLMNDVMSFGLHRLWKWFAIELCQLRKGQKILDLAGGTGDLSARISPIVGESGNIVLADINSEMLKVGRSRLIDRGLIHNIKTVQCDAEKLPFPDNYFDCVIIGFGLRNVTHKENALCAMYQAIKPGGRLIVLEFSQVQNPLLKPLFKVYSFNIIPLMGKLIANDSKSYRYLAESIKMHPDQHTLKNMLLTAGFDECKLFNLNGGIVAIHQGFKY
jgi:demethylmenaquinone methyltransferase / 2-methoxy-6-polyprenyl-1,4-benzoquinol methylase